MLKPTHTVWWLETDPVTGKTERVFRDFQSHDDALKFKRGTARPRITIVSIDLAPWHPQHAQTHENHTQRY